jgi:hypothetical protein
MGRDVMIALAMYWSLGMAWVITGLLPRPLGWLHLRSEVPLIAGAIFIIVGGAVWLLILGKILYCTLIKGEKETRF